MLIKHEEIEGLNQISDTRMACRFKEEKFFMNFINININTLCIYVNYLKGSGVGGESCTENILCTFMAI